MLLPQLHVRIADKTYTFNCILGRIAVPLWILSLDLGLVVYMMLYRTF